MMDRQNGKLAIEQSDHLSAEDKDLGLANHIDRRDFVGMVIASAGGLALPGMSARANQSESHPPSGSLEWTLTPDQFNGPSGIGDYANCNGNIWQVIDAAHRIRDQSVPSLFKAEVTDTGELYDLVVVGGGPSGLASAYHFHKKSPSSKNCLILENHPMFGGMAKRNEMRIGGVRIMAPQGSNVFSSSSVEAEGMISPKILRDIGLDPSGITYGELEGSDRDLEFDRTGFVYYYPPANSDSLGFFFDSEEGYQLLRNPWAKAFDAAPISDSLKKELMRWRFETAVPADVRDPDRWLDSMTYQDYLIDVHGFSQELCRIVNKFIGGGKAFNGEMCSAYAMSFNRYAGLVKRPFRSLHDTFAAFESGTSRADGFPGGNAAITRYFAKHLIPDLIIGAKRPFDILTNPIRFEALDRDGQKTRIRLSATVRAVKHVGPPERSRSVEIVYEKGGRLYRVVAKHVVMASGSWVNKHLLADAPERLRLALGQMKHSPVLVANVALNNWRFMERAGVTCCLWDRGEFGFQCNLRQPMHDGDFRPPLDPNKPIFLTFYAPFVYPGQNAATQVTLGRMELFSTPFKVLERRIRVQLTRMFGRYGFDPGRDIGGIILNRWGHAYIVPEPGFFFARDAQHPAREVVNQGYGRVAFAHSELHGFQSIQTAVLQAESAVEQTLGGLLPM